MASSFHYLQLGRVRDLPIGAYLDLDEEVEGTTSALAIYGEPPFPKQIEYTRIYAPILFIYGTPCF